MHQPALGLCAPKIGPQHIIEHPQLLCHFVSVVVWSVLFRFSFVLIYVVSFLFCFDLFRSALVLEISGGLLGFTALFAHPGLICQQRTSRKLLRLGVLLFFCFSLVRLCLAHHPQSRLQARRILFCVISKPDTATPPALAALPGPYSIFEARKW